ncbi:hypothetical protein EV121DRAFT_252818 [Schizophyllum commune]
MGNVQSGSTLTRTTGALDSFVGELGGDVVYDKSLGAARFLKTVKCRHPNGFLVVKIFIKPDPGLSLRTYARRLKVEREALSELPNIYSYQSFVETERAGYIIRQYVASNLYDRISTRPFLSPIEKKWIAYQVLSALSDARARKVSHGDIKSENILVTSWNWIYLTDFASYKPTYLPLDDPADFSFFFDTAGRRTCYLAPERFYTADSHPAISAKKSRLAEEEGGEGEGRRDGRVTEAMDVFGAGCVLAELFLEGEPLFTLSQLFKYRDGEYAVDGPLARIEDEGARTLIKQMISLDPALRPTFDDALTQARGTVFPETFYTFLHQYVLSVNELPATSPFGASTPAIPSTPVPPGMAPSTSSATVRPSSGGASREPESGTTMDVLPSDSDRRIERLWTDWETIEAGLSLAPSTTEEDSADVKVQYGYSAAPIKSLQDVLPVQLHLPGYETRLTQGPAAALEDGPALIILALVSSNVRNCSLPSSKTRALDLLLALCPHLTDEAKLDRMVPYIVDLLHDDAATVRSSALRTLIQVLMLVTALTPSNAAIFPEYIIPNIWHLVQDADVSVRCMYAQCIVQFANTAVRYLEMGQALRAHGTFQLSTEPQEYEAADNELSYDASMQDLQNAIQQHLSALLTDPSSVVKRAVLHDISSLCIFLGRQRTNDVLLSHIITYLNDRDWMLRHAFFESIVDVAACAGGRSLEEYILPLMIQALSDVEESVVAKVLGALTSLCDIGLFQKMRLWELMSATLGFLYHPNVWIRQAAAAFISSAARPLPDADVWCILYPSLRHFLKSDVATIDEKSLLMAMKPPLSRQIFDAAVQWAMKSDKSNFWRGQRRARTESPRESVVAIRKSGNTIARNRNEEDDAQLAKLKQMGMSSTEESKLLAMRDYILKLANATASFGSRLGTEVETEKNLKTIEPIELPKLNVVPQTIFLDSRTTTPTTARPRLYSSPRKAGLEMTPRSMPMSPLGRIVSLESPAPFEDLRRRLATINGSAASVGTPPPSSPRQPNPMQSLAPFLPSPASPSPAPRRPDSPTESIVSTTNSSAFRPPSRLQVGSMDTHKAAPLIGSSRANATGVLEAHATMREISPSRSGRSSPTSMHGGPSVQRPGLQHLRTLGTEPSVNNLLEHIVHETNRELQNDFGPKVHEGPVRRRTPVRHGFGNRDGSRRTEATLVAHLSPHSAAITGIAVSPDHMFFVSASDDMTVKVWDSARLERNVTSKPRHTYTQHHARVKCVCTLEGVHCFASAADDGSLHVVRVHVSQSGAVPKYGKLQTIREYRVDNVGEYITCMSHFNTDNASNLVYCTTHSTITILDLRLMRVLQTMENPRQYGPITCMTMDRKRTWILVGTSTGVLSLWDRRFGLLLKSWHTAAASNGKCARIHQCVVHPTKGKGKWIMAAVETAKQDPEQGHPAVIAEVWDIEKMQLMETFVTRTSLASEPFSQKFDASGTEADTSPASAIAALVRSRQAGADRARLPSDSIFKEEPAAPAPDIRCLVVGTEFGGHTAHVSDYGTRAKEHRLRGFMLSGSEDRKMRVWDLEKPDRTAILTGADAEQESPKYSTVTEDGSATAIVETWPPAPSPSSTNRPTQRLSLITNNQQNLLKAHQDIITALACIDSPFRGGVVSGDRSGALKVWRVDVGVSDA